MRGQSLNAVSVCPHAFLDERASAQLIDGCHQLLTGVHHDRPMPGDGLLQGRAGYEQEAHAFLASELASFTTAQELFASGGAVPLVRQTLDEYSAEEF